MRALKRSAFVSQMLLPLSILVLSVACQAPTATVQDATCIGSDKPYECDFMIVNPSDAAGPFKFAIVVSDPQHSQVEPVNSQELGPGVT